MQKTRSRHIANTITGSRILFALLMLFFPVFSLEFYALYLLAGISDMVDGTIARKTGGVSDFGARLDTAADMVFAAVSLMKFLPALPIPVWLWVWMGGIAVFRLGNLAAGYVRSKKMIALHTTLNKITGLLLFLLPLTLPFMELKYTAAAVCVAATGAAIQDGYYSKTGREIL